MITIIIFIFVSPRIAIFRSHTIQSGYSFYLSPTPQTTLDGDFEKYNSFILSSYPELIPNLQYIREVTDDTDKSDSFFSRNERIKINTIRKKCDMIKSLSKILRRMADSLAKIVELTLNRINIEYELRSGVDLDLKKEAKLYKHKTKRSFSNQEKLNRKERIHVINDGNN